eukprot:GFUD01081262.1.p1 GENE.GFUD01081262.1~~GFUD01081262.1.p1  ORF type:complete len:1085 (+),score=306.25 GFUD01081262.1:146-3400(+)
MGGPFMVEIVFCRVTRRGRKKKAGMNKLARENCRNDGPMQSFIPPDNMVKLTLDLSDTGPVFSALDEMMLKMSMDGIEDSKGKPKGGNAKAALKNLLKSGIPGIEGMLGGEEPAPRFGKGGGKKGFNKMNDASKKKFMSAIFGEEGTQIDSSTAAALLAATCSGGNPDIGNRLAELLVPEMDEKVDPAMMAALMSACSLINAGAGTEEVMNIMKMELAASGLSEEEILHKTQLLMKAFGKEEVGSTAEYKLLSKQKNKALIKAEIPPKDFSAIVLAHKAIASCGASPENCAKVLMIYSTLSKKGANPMHVAQAMKNLGTLSDENKTACQESILKSWENPKFAKLDVMVPVRMHQALDNENEPGWAEVKALKDIVGGVSPNSPEAIELNLSRATKSAGLKKDDIGRALVAFKAISLLGVDPVTLAKIMFMEKTICENGVPGSEVGRVLNDGVMPTEATQSLIDEVKDKLCEETKPNDIEHTVNVYNNLKFKSNIPTEVIEFVDKSLIQVRCSLEDVADNMISSLSARGEKTSRIVGQVTEMLKKTGATAHVTATTLMPPLVELTGEKEVVLVKTVARNLKDVDYESEEIKGAVTDMIVKIIEDDPAQHAEGVASIEATLKDFGMSLPEIKAYVGANLPPPPTPPEEVERRRQVAEELERLEKAEQERDRLTALKLSDPEAYEREMNPKPAHKGLEGLKSDSRRGSLLLPESRSRQGSIVLGGTERRGSYYHDEVTTRASVAMVTDDPEHKKNLKTALAGAFGEVGTAGVNGPVNGNLSSVIANGGEEDNLVNGNANGMSMPGMPGSLPPGTSIQKNSDGSISVGGKKLPPGASLQTNPDGSVSIAGGILAGLPADASEEEITKRLKAAGMSEADVKKMMGASKGKGLSPESRALMEQILASTSSQDEISSRVSALLAGTALSTSRGVAKGEGREIDMVEYEGANLSEARERKDGFEMPDIPYVPIPDLREGTVNGVRLRDHSGGAGSVKRGSIKRQSEIMREKKKSRQEEREEERERKASYFRKVTGLRRAKVPLMVYSCGGFSRCFRIARFYDVEGPPVGVEYSRNPDVPNEHRDDRKELNPDL